MYNKIYDITKNLGLSRKEVDSIMSSSNTTKSNTGSTNLYKAGTDYGTVSTKDIYKSGSKYGTFSIRDIL